MTITELVQLESRKGWRWADTKKTARIHREIGEPVTLDLAAQGVHPDWRKNPIGFAKLHVPYRSELPGRTEVSFYVVADNSASNTPSITVQYVEAKR